MDENRISKQLIEYLEYKHSLGLKIKLGLELWKMLFYNTKGNSINLRSVEYAFQLIRKTINAKPIGYKNIRLYDFSYAMACNTIQRWTEQDIDVNCNLQVLSTYLGHVKPENTYWYL